MFLFVIWGANCPVFAPGKLLGKAFHVPVQGLDEGRVDFPEHRENQVAEFVALEVVLRVGAVFPPGEPLLPGKSLDIGPCHSQQGPVQGDVGIFRVRDKAFGLHADKALEPGSAEEVQQQRFRVVVGIVGHGHPFVSVFAAQLSEPAVAQPPGRHLYADSICRCKRLCVKMFYMDGDAVPSGPFFHKCFVAVTLCPPQAEVAMGHGKRSAFQADLLSQADGVNASADSYEQHLSVSG